MYGKHWLDLWDGAPMGNVKAVWQEDLAGVTGEQIRKALDHCKSNSKYPPTCPEFVALCRQFRDAPSNVLYLPAPRGELPPESAALLHGFGSEGRKDCLGWARAILDQSAKGVLYPAVSLELAKEALSVE